MRLFKGNRAFTGGAANDAAVYDAATQYDAYQAAVAAATGEIVENATIHALNEEFIGDLIAHNLYSNTKLALLGSGGTKNIVTPASGQKVYSMGPDFYANDAHGAGSFVNYSGGAYAKPTLIFSGAGNTAYLEWNAFQLAEGERLSVIMLSPNTLQNTGQGVNLKLTDGTDLYVFDTGAGHYAKVVSAAVVEPEVELRPEYNLNTYVPAINSWHFDEARRVLTTLNGNTLDGSWIKGSEGVVTEKVSKLYHAAAVPEDGLTGTLRVQGNTSDVALAELVIVQGNHSIDDALAFAALRQQRFVA